MLEKRFLYRSSISGPVAIIFVSAVLCGLYLGSSNVRPEGAEDAMSVTSLPSKKDVLNDQLVAGYRPGEPAEREPRFRRGEEIIYRFEDSRVVLLPAPFTDSASSHPAPGDPFELGFQVEGRLSMKVYDNQEIGWIVGFQLTEVRCVIRSPSLVEPEETEELAHAMTGEVVTVMDTYGEIRRVIFPPTMPREVHDQWKALLIHMQIVLPEDPTLMEWENSETGLTGTCTVRYRRTTLNGEAELVKQRISHTKTSDSGDADLSGQLLVDGETSILLRDGLPVKIEGRERFQIDSGEQTRLVDSEEVFVFVQESRRFKNELIREGRLQTRIAESMAGTTLALSQDKSKSSTLKDNLLDELATAEQLYSPGSEPTDDAIRCMGRLVALLENDLTNVEKVLDYLWERNPNPELYAMMLGAMGAAGTAAAQEGLERVISSTDWPEAIRETALISLVQVEHPLPQLDGTLMDLYEQKNGLSSTALLQLGVIADRTQEVDVERSGLIREYVLEVSADPDLTLGERIAALEALGNLGPKETPSSVLQAYRDDDEVMRTAAIRALQRTYDLQAGQLLLTALHEDPREGVRVAAVDGLLQQEREVELEPLAHVLLNDPSETVRRHVLGGLSRFLNTDQSARRLVTLMAQNDPSADLQEYARGVLQGGNSGS